MKKFIYLLIALFLLISYGCNANSEQILKINPKVNNIVINKKSGTQITDEEKQDIKLILSQIIYCEDNYLKFCNADDLQKKKQKELLRNTADKIKENANEREKSKKSDRESQIGLQGAAAEVDGMGAFVYGDFSKYDSMETYNLYNNRKKECLRHLYNYYDIILMGDIKQYFNTN